MLPGMGQESAFRHGFSSREKGDEPKVAGKSKSKHETKIKRKSQAGDHDRRDAAVSP
jgi:hypothetical protein